MTPEAFKSACRELRLSPRDFAGILGVPDLDAIRLWTIGGAPIPGRVVFRVQHLLNDWRWARRTAERVIDQVIKPQIAEQGAALREISLTIYDRQSIARLQADEPDVSLSMHNMVNRATAMLLETLGIATRVAVITEANYAAWLGGRTDSRDLRSKYAGSGAPSYRLSLPLGSTPLGDALLRLQDIPDAVTRLGVERDEKG
jgi:hypothetical protein